MTPTDPLAESLLESADPPPPYPSSGRRSRTTRATRTSGRHPHLLTSHAQLSSTDSDHHHPFPVPASEDENTPLLSSPHSPAISGRRPRTLSSSTVVSSSSRTPSSAPSLVHTVFSLFHSENSDNEYSDFNQNDEDRLALRSPDSSHGTCLPGQRRSWPLFTQRAWRKYFQPFTQVAYYNALFHLLVLNFPYALAAWIYLFVFTLTGTTLLMALPLGMVLSFFDLLGARAFARGELALQTRFHTHLAYPTPHPPRPIFTRLRTPTPSDIESGRNPGYETSFYKNAYAMFTDPTTYTALFYFLLIKPSITLLLTILLIILVPPCFIFILPAPALLRAVRKVGRWQANVAVEGLCYRIGSTDGVYA